MKRPPIRTLELSGTPESIGHEHGKTFADEIRAYTKDRIELVSSGLWSGGSISETEVIEIAESMLPAHQNFDEDLHAEMLALASAAGISPAEAVIVGGFTDFVDAVRAVIGAETPGELQEDDCTSMIIPDSRAHGSGFLAQTWDMHDTATDHVLLLKIIPTDQPASLIFTTTGCLGQLGMNDAGVAVGINNLNCLDGKRGVTWTSVVRGMLKAESSTEALNVLLEADLAGAHNYLIFDSSGDGYNIEAMPSVRPVITLGSDPLVHTNHTIQSEASDVQASRDASLLESSVRRLEKAQEILEEGTVDSDRLMTLTRDPEAICQTAKEPYFIESSGAAIMRPATQDFWACWGRPAENEYESVDWPHG
ncbi:MAG: C45 family peptidase [Actinomycetota bacterium]|nr:hypothetical protein [Dehalococcoidia bacterium]MEC7909596.1 C45 family peptidase [Actinomycetota bacterium]